ncbi:DnaJ- protein scj1 [Tilletia horrida]|uniref:DnaJ- protein scj1 n=1 Tax=Tilletia horrida TaxID=155126 RepID=A0AAN6GEH3_9BASI|nr:DnaJ- protein scj1 [Tilletia horrida]KAK0561021.1 DnaJ- protein scj1 [Tilletia horrida]
MRSFASAWKVVLFIVLALLPALVQAARDYYKILDVDKSASDRDIKRAYRKRAQKIHPDKHPDKQDEFVELSEAYQTLIDPELRKIYDRHGADGVKRHQQGQAAGGNQDPFDVFRHFFGGDAFGGGGDFVRKGPNKNFHLQFDLADFYKGRKLGLSYDREVLCSTCDGSGARSKSDIHSCETCQGRGVRVVRQQIMPGFHTTAQVTCDQCGGQGRVIKHACPACNGRKLKTEKTEIQVEVEPGMKEGEEITFEGDSDEGPDFEPGDVIVKLTATRSKGDFRRRDTHLYTTYPIGLDDALLGFEHTITHMDGHNVTLKRSSVTQPGFVQTIAEEGMPIRENGAIHGHGNLYVEYQVVLPERVDGDLRTALQRVFGRKQGTTKDAHEEL